MLYHSRGLEKFIKNNYGEAIEDFRTALQFTDSSEQIIYKNIVYSKLWQKYYRNEKWLKFEKKEIADLIREVYPKNYKTPTVEEFIKGN